MKVLTVYAHHEPRSFCHPCWNDSPRASPPRGTRASRGPLRDRVRPRVRCGDNASYIDAECHRGAGAMDPKQRVLDGCRGPLERWLAARALRGKSPQEVAEFIRSHA